MELYVDVMTREDAEKAGMLDLPWRNGSYLKDYSMVNDYQYWTEEWIYVRKKKEILTLKGESVVHGRTSTARTNQNLLLYLVFFNTKSLSLGIPPVNKTPFCPND